MPRQDSLFDLIHSLSSREKGYIKRYSKLHSGGGQIYLRLFDIMESQSAYNEQAIIKKLGSKFSGNKLSVTKYYLKGLILKAMRNYHGGASVQSEVLEYIADIEFLFLKGLDTEMHKTIQKAKAMAEEFELFAEQEIIQAWERKIAYLGGKLPEVIESSKEHLKVAELLVEGIRYEQIYCKIVYGFINEPNKGRKEIDYSEMLNDPLLKGEPEFKSSKAKQYYLNSYAHYYANVLDRENWLKYSGKLMECIRETEQFKRTGYSGFLYPEMISLVYAQFSNDHYEEALVGCNEMRKALDSNKHEYNRATLSLVKFTLFQLEMFSFLATGDSDKANELSQEAEVFLNEAERDPTTLMFHFLPTCYAVMVVRFCMEKYSEAAYWGNKILQLDDNEHSMPHLFLQTRFTFMITQFELKNYELFISTWRSTERILNKKKERRDFENMMMKGLKRLSKVQSKEELTSLSKELKTELVKFKTESYTMRVLQYNLWFDSKIQGLSLPEVASQKFNE